MPVERDLRIEKLTRAHDQGKFDCREKTLNEYLKRYARQNAKKGLGATYVAVETGKPGGGKTEVLGYYTISSGQVAPDNLPDEERKALPRYPVPVVRIGRLAVDQRFQGQGLGEILLIDALKRALAISEEVGIYALEVDALTEAARSFYERYGFDALIDDDLHLYISIRKVAKLFGQ